MRPILVLWLLSEWTNHRVRMFSRLQPCSKAAWRSRMRVAFSMHHRLIICIHKQYGFSGSKRQCCHVKDFTGTRSKPLTGTYHMPLDKGEEVSPLPLTQSRHKSCLLTDEPDVDHSLA